MTGFLRLLAWLLPLALAGPAFGQATQGDYSPIIMGEGNTAIFGSLDVTSSLDQLDSGRLLSIAKKGNVWQIAASLNDPGVAQRFFRNLKMARKGDLLVSLLQAGLDPNALSRTPQGGSEALIVAAMRASNAQAIVSLLNAGSSPHGYQEILFSDSRYPFFMFPHLAILQSSTFTASEKNAILNAMMAKGVVLLKSPGMSQKVEQDIDDVRIAHPQARWQEFEGCTPPEQYQCGSVDSERVCELNTRLKGMIATPSPRDFNEDYRSFFPKDYIGQNEGRSYYLAASPGGWSSTVALVEIAADERSMRLLKFSSPSAGMGLCNPKSDGYVPKECWRALNLDIDRNFETATWMGSAKMTFMQCPR